MNRTIPITAIGVTPLATAAESFTGRVTVQIVVLTGVPTFTLHFRARVTPPRVAVGGVPNEITAVLDAAAPTVAYRDSALTTQTAGATGIAAVGIYDVDITNLDVAAHVSALASGTIALIVGGAVVS